MTCYEVSSYTVTHKKLVFFLHVKCYQHHNMRNFLEAYFWGHSICYFVFSFAVFCAS